jgi:predicted N-acetyltransferase YhbS
MIHYSDTLLISNTAFIDLLNRSTLGQRRPVNEPERIQTMLQHGNVLVTAWDNEKLVGVSRALTDFSFCSYLSDLAVDEDYQHQGIGKKLIELTHQASGGDKVTLILIAAPAAIDYYPKIGMQASNACFIIPRVS